MKRPKHVVVLYVINYTYLHHYIVVLDRYTNSNLDPFPHHMTSHTIMLQNRERTKTVVTFNTVYFVPKRK